MRLRLPDHHFDTQKSIQAQISFPLLTLLRRYPQLIFLGILITGFCSVTYYTVFNYVSIFLTTQAKWTLSSSLLLMGVGSFPYILFSFGAGYLADRYGIKRLCLLGSLSIFCFIIPIFYSLTHADSFITVIICQIALGSLGGLQGPILVCLSALFPVEVRYTGFALSYNIGVALFGGTMPVIASLLIKWTGNPLMPAFYISGLALIGFLSLKFAPQYALHPASSPHASPQNKEGGTAHSTERPPTPTALSA